MSGPDRGLNELLKWSIENSNPAANGTPQPNTNGDSTAVSTRGLDPEAIAALFGGPSDADLMQAAMSVITDTDPSVSLDNKLIAFDNFEQLIESLDNANNMSNLSLWSPLLGMLEHAEAELRKMAAWCIGTAVQNNAPSQERLLAMGGIPTLVALATRQEEDAQVKRKAIYALSSAVRNYQPAMDVAAEELTKQGRQTGQVDAQNMDAVDVVINGLKTPTVNGTA